MGLFLSKNVNFGHGQYHKLLYGLVLYFNPVTVSAKVECAGQIWPGGEN